MADTNRRRSVRIAGPVDLAAALQGGQAFRWRQSDAGGPDAPPGGHTYVGTIGERLVEMRPRTGGAVEVQAWPRTTRARIERYLGADASEDARRERLANDPVLAPALNAHPGLRILRQDPWETTVAFITSANNNVLRIEGIMTRLAEAYGAPCKEGDRCAHTFPSAKRLARATDAKLRALGLGYRAPFVRESARLVARGEVDLESLRGAAPTEARQVLMQLPGVGPKVADCIGLFGLDVTGAFPLDRWVLRAVAEAFFDGESRTPRDIETFARERWGADAGLAQQYLFHAIRMAHAAPGTNRKS